MFSIAVKIVIVPDSFSKKVARAFQAYNNPGISLKSKATVFCIFKPNPTINWFYLK